MPLTKTTPEVIDIDKLTIQLKSNALNTDVHDFVNTNVAILESTLVNSIAANFTTLNNSIVLLENATNTAIQALEKSLTTRITQDLIKRFGIPIGTIYLWPSDIIMPNLNDYGTYVALTGQFLLKADYPELYQILKNGTNVCIYGENATQFKVPNFSARVPTMMGTTYDANAYPQSFNIGFFGGEFQHTLNIQEMPNHNHTINVNAPAVGAGENNLPHPGAIVNGTTSTVGGSQAHNIMQPFIVTNMIIKAKHAPSIIY